MAKPVLGRGLGALLKSYPSEAPLEQAQDEIEAVQIQSDAAGRVLRVPLEAIVPSSLQPRKDFADEALEELANSIREEGILQPLIVRRQGERYELIAGERRWRASQKAGLAEVPVIVREGDDRNALALMLIENLQREDLNPVEEARGYTELAEKFQLTQEEIAVRVGKSRTAVANAVRLLNLAPAVQQFLREGRLSVGHAKVILGLPTHTEQSLAADRILRKGLSVRQSEELVAQWGKTPDQRSGNGKSASRNLKRDSHLSHLSDLENRLRDRFGTKVALKYRDGKGSLEIRFFNDDDLNRVLDILGVHLD